MSRKLKNYGLKFDKSIERWDEAIPIGNGKLGALIYGDGPIKYALDRMDLWDERDSVSAMDKNFKYKKLIECARNGEQGAKDKRDIFEQNHVVPYPTKLSAGRIEIDFGEKSDSVRTELDIETAFASASCNDFKLYSFVAATEPVGIIRVYGKYSLNVHIPDYFSGDENGNWSAPSGLVYNSGELHIVENGCLKYPRSKVETDGDFVYYKQQTLDDYTFVVMFYTKKFDEYNEIYYTITTTVDDKDPVKKGKEILLSACEKGYDKILVSHKAWWKKYWNKSHISIPDKELEKSYYFSWYLFASTSRKGGYPMPLQGVWTADSNALPPWGGDYHHDTNTQMSYWGYCKANRFEEGRVFADYLWNLRGVFRKHAKKVYGVNGYMIPGCSTLNGKFMGGCVQYSLSPSMTVWAAKALDDYYRYTGDLSYLKNRAYPFMKGVADAIFGLFEERNGKYYLPISSTPEIYEGSIEDFYIGNTNFDQSLMLYLFKTMIEYCELLGLDKTEYENIMSKLDGLYVSEDKILKLSETMKLPYSHRHFSHMMCIYPLHVINYDTPENRKIIDNTIWEIEQLGTGWWVGFSFPWCATMYAMQYNGNAAYEKLRVFVKGFISPNGFHLNGDYKKRGFSQWHYRPFTLEALYAYCDSLQEMLMQEYKGYVELFPSIPDDWKESASFEKFISYGGVSVSAKIKRGQISASFTVKKSTTIKIKNVFGQNGVKVNYDGVEKIVNVAKFEIFEIELLRGKTSIVGV